MGFRVEDLPDTELEVLNDLLPWAFFTVDSKGRNFGKPYSSSKRAKEQTIPDRRIVDFNAKYPLAGQTVLKVGRFEGIHTCAYSELAEKVIAIDSRIENVVKTMVRCSLYGYNPEVYRVDLEEPLPNYIDLQCDVLSHIGVLYHLTDPVGHLFEISKLTGKVLLLDTHVAKKGAKLEEYSVNGESYAYMEYKEKGRKPPFAGMKDHAKWLLLECLMNVLEKCGFVGINLIEERNEKNGLRVLIYAAR